MKTTVNSVSCETNESKKQTNLQVLNTTAKQAKHDIKQLGIMYWCRQLDKLAKKNEYCENINVLDIAKQVKALHTYPQFFAPAIFTEDSKGRACYVTTSKKPVDGEKFDVLAISEDGKTEYLKPVTLSLVGVLNACQHVLKPLAKAKDNEEKQALQAERKAAAKARAEERKAIRAEQKQALEQLKAGAICHEEYARIMMK